MLLSRHTTSLIPRLQGLFYVTNFGISAERVDKQWDLARSIFIQPEAELNGHIADLANGDYSGYRPLGLIEQYPGLRDNFESYNIYKLNAQQERDRPHAKLVREIYDEIEAFQRDTHQLIAYRVLELLARLLDVPAETFIDKHSWDAEGSSFLRYLKYHPRSAELNAKYDNIYTRAHTDFGSITILFSNVVGGLQIQTLDGYWHAVDHIPGSAVVSFADIVSIWSKRYVRSCMHRVIAPPLEQQHLERFSLIYFLRPSNASRLEPLDSSVLTKRGLAEQPDSEETRKKLEMTVGEWVKAHTSGKVRKADAKAQSETAFESFFQKKSG